MPKKIKLQNKEYPMLLSSLDRYLADVECVQERFIIGNAGSDKTQRNKLFLQRTRKLRNLLASNKRISIEISIS